jgi:hypothetical protein
MYMMPPRRVTIGVRGQAISIPRVWGIRIDSRLEAAIACHEKTRGPISEGTRGGKSWGVSETDEGSASTVALYDSPTPLAHCGVH